MNVSESILSDTVLDAGRAMVRKADQCLAVIDLVISREYRQSNRAQLSIELITGWEMV